MQDVARWSSPFSRAFMHAYLGYYQLNPSLLDFSLENSSCLKETMPMALRASWVNSDSPSISKGRLPSHASCGSNDWLVLWLLFSILEDAAWYEVYHNFLILCDISCMNIKAFGVWSCPGFLLIRQIRRRNPELLTPASSRTSMRKVWTLIINILPVTHLLGMYTAECAEYDTWELLGATHSTCVVLCFKSTQYNWLYGIGTRMVRLK
jgi:hypothetical protein